MKYDKIKARKYLEMAADGDLDLQGAALKGWKNPVNPKFTAKGLQYSPKRKLVMPPLKGNVLNPKNANLIEHDRKYHGGHWDGKSPCKYRQGMYTFGINSAKAGSVGAA